jgi:hypothetical protein
VRWATPQLHDIDALAKMVDPALNGMYPAKSLSRFADIIALCVQVNSLLMLKINFTLSSDCDEQREITHLWLLKAAQCYVLHTN